MPAFQCPVILRPGTSLRRRLLLCSQLALLRCQARVLPLSVPLERGKMRVPTAPLGFDLVFPICSVKVLLIFRSFRGRPMACRANPRPLCASGTKPRPESTLAQENLLEPRSTSRHCHTLQCILNRVAACANTAPSEEMVLEARHCCARKWLL